MIDREKGNTGGLRSDRRRVGLDAFSLCTSRVSIFRHDPPLDPIELGAATAFFFESGNDRYLITNWHNVSGMNPNTGKAISSSGARPTNFAVRLLQENNVNTLYLNVGLYDNNGNPTWLVHPEFRSKVDVVAIPMTIDNFGINTFVGGSAIECQIGLDVGIDVFVIGYPQGIDHHLLPIWKRGSLAVDVDSDLPYWLIDCASRAGMSGAPVVVRRWAPFEDVDGRLFSGGRGTRFVGIYSGRFEDKDPFGAHMGIVWPRFLLEEIISGGCFDTSMER